MPALSLEAKTGPVVMGTSTTKNPTKRQDLKQWPPAPKPPVSISPPESIRKPSNFNQGVLGTGVTNENKRNVPKEISPRSTPSVFLYAATRSNLSSFHTETNIKQGSKRKSGIKMQSTPVRSSSVSMDAAIISKLNQYNEENARFGVRSGPVVATGSKSHGRACNKQWPPEAMPTSYKTKETVELAVDKNPSSPYELNANEAPCRTQTPGAVMVRPSMSVPHNGASIDWSSSDGSHGDSIPDENIDHHVIEATTVKDTEIVGATAVSARSIKRRRIAAGVGALLLVCGVAGLAVGLTSRDDTVLFVEATPSPTASPLPTLMRVIQEGVLRCGVTNKIGFSFENEGTGVREGFDIDLVRGNCWFCHY